jgi:hypothetical protein
MWRGGLLVVNVLLLGAAAWLGADLYRSLATAPPAGPARPEDAAPASGPAAASPAEPPRAQRPALANYAVVAERNLFSPNRSETPPEPPRPGAPATPTPPPQPKPRLYGIVVRSDGQARAYLEDVQRRKVFPYAVGDVVADSRVEEIKLDRVVLRRGTEVFEVMLRDPTKPRPPAPAPTPTPGVAPRPGAVPPGQPEGPAAGRAGAPTVPRPRTPAGVQPGVGPGPTTAPARPEVAAPGTRPGLGRPPATSGQPARPDTPDSDEDEEN